MNKRISASIMLALVMLATSSACSQEPGPPPDSAATVSFTDNLLVVTYEGHAILQARINQLAGSFSRHTVVDTAHGCVNEVIAFTANEWDSAVTLTGEITGGPQSFPCEADRAPAGLDVVRHCYGLSHSILNRAVYDRKRDWVVSFDYFSQVVIEPDSSKKVDLHRFHFVARGNEVILRFRPHYYQKHRGLDFFEPWTYSIWPSPVTGWCSWFAYYQDISEEKIKKVADVLSETLLPFGFTYLQIDDGFQRGEGLPPLWLQPNEKFPGGLNVLSEYIRARGLKPGIWTNMAFNQHEFAEEHKEWFVLDDHRKPAIGNWINLSIDGSNATAIDSLVRPIYRGLRGMGWEYFKVDALRHLRYEGYNSHAQYFRDRNLDRVTAFRGVARAVREEIGSDVYMLGCWGIRPELIGIIDGCRIGTDGYSYAGLAQYNSYNNVVWRNDPDHIVLSREEAYRSTMVTSLTGSVMMLTDKPELYNTEIIEPAKRAAPVLMTVPCQLYDVDPSRSEMLGRVNSEVSGSGPRPFDAGSIARCDLFSLEIDKPFEHWLMFGRVGESHSVIRFGDLGLPPSGEYCVFEFWSKRFLGTMAIEFRPGRIDSNYNCQLFCIRKKQAHPQLIATSRHISCGGLDVDELGWNDSVLSGTSECVRNDPYEIYTTEPAGYRFSRAECAGSGSRIIETKKNGDVRVSRIIAGEGGRVWWKIIFDR